MMRTVRIAKTHVGKVHVVPLHGYRTLCGEPLGPVETIEAVRAAGNVVDEWAPGEAPRAAARPGDGLPVVHRVPGRRPHVEPGVMNTSA